MHRLALFALLLALPAHAGEKHLGMIVSVAGADTTNETTATPFFIPKGAKLTMVCNGTAYICVDTTTSCASTVGSDGGSKPGMPVTSGEKFPTSTGLPGSSSFPTATGTGGGGGSLTPAGGAVIRIFGTGAVACDVFSREGSE